MKETVVKNAVDNFVKRYGVNSDQIKEICETFLWKSIREFRNEDPFLYEEIYSRSTIQQTKLLEERLELDLIGFDEISKNIENLLCESYSKSFELNGNIDLEYIEEQIENILNDASIFFFENKEILEKIKNFSKEKIIGFFKQVFKKLPMIATGATLALPAAGVGILTSISMLPIVLLLSGIYSFTATKYFGVNVSKEQLTLIHNCFDVMNYAAKKVKDASEGIKYRYLITFKNEDRCYQKAGIDTEKLGFRAFASIKEDSIWRQLLFFSEEEKLDKLRNCFLENYLDRIAIFFELYFDCLRKTGKWNEVRSMSDDKIISMFRMNGGMFPICDEYRDHAVKAIRNFEDLVEFIFNKTPDKKAKWMILLNRYILDARESKDNIMKSHHNFLDKNKNRGFQTNKYQQMGKDLENSDY